MLLSSLLLSITTSTDNYYPFRTVQNTATKCKYFFNMFTKKYFPKKILSLSFDERPVEWKSQDITFTPEKWQQGNEWPIFNPSHNPNLILTQSLIGHWNRPKYNTNHIQSHTVRMLPGEVTGRLSLHVRPHLLHVKRRLPSCLGPGAGQHALVLMGVAVIGNWKWSWNTGFCGVVWIGDRDYNG